MIDDPLKAVVGFLTGLLCFLLGFVIGRSSK